MSTPEPHHESDPGMVLRVIILTSILGALSLVFALGWIVGRAGA